MILNSKSLIQKVKKS